MNSDDAIVRITFAGDVPPQEMDAFLDAVADAVHAFEPRTAWDPIMSATDCAVPGHGAPAREDQ